MDSLSNPLIKCKHCSTLYRKSNEQEHMQTCIDSFSLEPCPYCDLLFPVSALPSHIETHNTSPSSSSPNINTTNSLSSPSEHASSSPETFGFVDLTEDFNQLLEHELYMKKIYGNDKEYLDSKKKKFGKRLINFLYRNKLRFVGLGLAALGFVSTQGVFIMFGISMMIHGGSDKNYYDLKKKGNVTDIINLLPVSDIEEESKMPSELKCVICLEEFGVGDKFTALPCLHLFHFECIESYLKTKMQCPVCKLEITQESFVDKDFK